jgi:hypothetical protein
LRASGLESLEAPQFNERHFVIVVTAVDSRTKENKYLFTGRLRKEQQMAIASKIIVQVTSSEGKPCPLCDEQLMPFERACNHLLQEHHLKCLHIGQQTESSDYGPWHDTVAVFGE